MPIIIAGTKIAKRIVQTNLILEGSDPISIYAKGKEPNNIAIKKKRKYGMAF
jgi:hypothetical protein